MSRSALRLTVLALLTVAFFGANTRSEAGETLDNPGLIRLLENRLQLPVIIKKIEISTCQFDASSDALILISNAATKGGMKQEHINDLLLRVMDESGREKKRLRDLVAHFINASINRDPDNLQEYDASLRMLLREGKRVVPFLLNREYLEAENELKRHAVLDALAKLDDRSEATVRSVRLMLDDRNGAVRQKAAEAVAALSGPTTCDELIGELTRNRMQHLDGVAMSLGYLGDAKATEHLTTLLKRSVDADAKLAAAFALGLLRTKDKRAVSAILEAVLDDRDERLRATAARAAGEIGDPRGVSYIKRAYQRYRRGRPELILNLKLFKSADAVEFLIADCASSDNAKVRQSAIHTLKVLAGEDYDSAEEWESWWSINKETPEWIRVDKLDQIPPEKKQSRRTTP